MKLFNIKFIQKELKKKENKHQYMIEIICTIDLKTKM